MKSTDKIAIVGYSHRLPGEERGDFWDLLLRGEDLVTEVAEDRWAKETYLHPNKSEPGRAYSFASGSVGDISGFDAGFFGISPREAAQMDPQQRLLLELVWSAFEKGGIKPSLWKGSKSGVFVGISSTDNTYRSIDDLAGIDSTSATGNTMSIAANRLSYFFDLRGPSMSVDTACSSSLVAFHQACLAMEHGEADSAVVAGVSLHLHPMGFINFSKTSMLSKKGRCTPFDADGDGYARSEGAGVVLLKKLSKAIKDGDRIFAVVAGTGVNCDGKTSSLTVPSSEAQAALLRDVYAKAGISPDELSYVEAHGTGTAVGDPIETRALGEVLGATRKKSPLPIGSVKSNIGHLEAASGMAGLMKALLVLQHRTVPPTIHLKKPNANIHFEEWGLKVPTETTKLPDKGKLTVGINSFGFGGANAHIILQSPPEKQQEVTPAKGEVPERATLFLSAKTPAALKSTAAAYADWLEQHPDESIYDLAWAARNYREWFDKRLAAEGSRQDVLQSLKNWLDCGEEVGAFLGNQVKDANAPVFVFSGNGSQYAGMGRNLLKESSLFRKALREVDELFMQRADFSIVEMLEDPSLEAELARTEVAQPLLFGIQVALVRMLNDEGIRPAGVVGHSVGEVAAAWACGALTLMDAVKVIHERSIQQGKTRGEGMMTAVALSKSDAESLLEEIPEAIRPHLAGVNSPRGITVAGNPSGLSELEALLGNQGVRFKRLDLDYAFHSPSMDPIRWDLVSELQDLSPKVGDVPFYSTVTGELLDGSKLDADYWWKNVRDPVLFHDAIKSAIDQGFTVFVEVGPHPVLRTYMTECLKEANTEGLVAALMTRKESSLNQFRKAWMQLVLAGIPMDEKRFFPVLPSENVELPGYQWQRSRYETPHSVEAYGIYARRSLHPLLGYPLKEESFGWENHLDTACRPFLKDHRVGGAVVFPAAGFVEMALAAGMIRHASEKIELENFEIHVPLLLSDAHSKTVRLSLDEGTGQFVIKSRDRLSEERWMTHVSGRVLKNAAAPSDLRQVMAVSPSGIPQIISSGDLYGMAAGIGLVYGEAFQSIDSIEVSGNTIHAKLKTPECLDGEMDGYLLHPSFLDGALHSLVALFSPLCSAGTADVDRKKAFLPIRADRFQLHMKGEVVTSAEVTVRKHTRRSLLTDITLKSSRGVVASVNGMRFRATQLVISPGERARFLTTEFISKPLPRSESIWASAVPDFASSVASELEKINATVSRQRLFLETEPLMEALCVAYAHEALQILTAGESTWNHDRLVETGVIAKTQEIFFKKLLETLVHAGMLKRDRDGTCEWTDEEVVPAHQILDVLIREHIEYSAIVRAIGRVGLHLADILRGDAPAEGFLPRDWADGPQLQLPGAFTDLHRALLSAIGKVVRTVSPTTRLKILWIMGNRVTGEVCITPWMKENSCDVTIAVPSTQARMDLSERMGSYPGVSLEIFDPFKKESFEEDQFTGKFDVVVAASEMGLFVEKGVTEYLAKLILPGGMLAFAESSFNLVWDFLFGGLADWWLLDDQGGALSRLREPSVWSEFIKGLGFENVRTLPQNKRMRKTGGPFVLMANTPGASFTSKAENRDAGEWILIVDDEASFSVGLDVSSNLEKAGGSTLLKSVQDQCRKGIGLSELEKEFSSIIGDASPKTRGVVFMTGLGERTNDPGAALHSVESRMLALNALLQEVSETRPDLPVAVVTAGVFHRENGHLEASSKTSATQAALLGMIRVARNEYDRINLKLIDLQDCVSGPFWGKKITEEMLNPDEEQEVRLGRETREVARITVSDPFASAPKSGAHVALDFSQPGSLKNLLWRRFDSRDPAPGEVEIEIRASGLNFRDVMYAMGLLPDEALESGFAGQTLGMELSGVITRVGEGVAQFYPGDEVIAFAPSAFANLTITREEAVMKKPAGWSFEAASTIPTAFFTVSYALEELARVRKGERLLIHGAAGGVGIAAIQIARYLGLEVFATAGSDEKRDFVRLIGADHVLDSRSLSFADDILSITGGQGVDVILNSLSGEAINRNLRVLRPFGRFLELGKRDFYENSRIGLRPFRNNLSYFGIDADQLMAEQPELTGRIFSRISDFFEEGVLHPLPHTVFDADEIAEGFRYMQHSRQIGKVVIRQEVGRHPEPVSEISSSRAEIHPDATYLITGGTSGFGLQSAGWLADRGAKSLVLMSRRGNLDETGRKAVASMEAKGASVTVMVCDVSVREDLEKSLASIREWMHPLKGVIHSAMVIDDGLLPQLSAQQLDRVMRPKVMGALLLDEMTREDDLDLFVLYSSATTCFGNPGQGAYVAANCVLESISTLRRLEGLPSTCVSWGPIGDAGYLARNEQIKDALCSRMGGLPLDSKEALRTLDALVAVGSGNIAWIDLEWAKLKRFLPSSSGSLFSMLRHLGDEESGAAHSGGNLREELMSLPHEELHTAVTAHLKHEISKILRIEEAMLDERKSLFDMGMDSLMGVELVGALESGMGIHLPILALSEGPTIEKLSTRIASMLRSDNAIPPESAENPTDSEEQVILLAAQHGVLEISKDHLQEIVLSSSAGASREPLIKSHEGR